MNSSGRTDRTLLWLRVGGHMDATRPISSRQNFTPQAHLYLVLKFSFYRGPLILLLSEIDSHLQQALKISTPFNRFRLAQLKNLTRVQISPGVGEKVYKPLKLSTD